MITKCSRGGGGASGFCMCAGGGGGKGVCGGACVCWGVGGCIFRNLGFLHIQNTIWIFPQNVIKSSFGQALPN